MNLQTLLNPFIASLILSLVITPFVILFAKRANLIDDPKTHKHPAIVHKKPLPRAGGLAIFLAIAISIFIFLPINSTYIYIIAAGLLVVSVGLLDDKYDLSPYLRFLGNILAASIVVFSGIDVPFLTNPLGGILYFTSYALTFSWITISISHILAIVWIVWVMNMLNWSKGVDGQMPGIAVVSAVIIGIASLRFPVLTDANLDVAQVSFIAGGAALGFLYYNFYPAKIFPGYSATILGFMIGTLSIMSGVKLATAILVMGVPAADFLFTFTRRILAHKSPFVGDRKHLHHLLLDIGWGHRSIAVFYWVMSLLLGVFALNLSSRGKLFAIILVVVLVGMIILSIKLFSKPKASKK